MSSAAAIPVLDPAPTSLDAAPIRQWLNDGVARIDSVRWQVRVVETTASTNTDLLASIRADGWSSPTVLAAEHQTAGRGRLGRAWRSTRGASLTVSFALRVARPMSALDGVTLVCGLAASDAIALHGVDARLKWPNDLLVEGRKLAGILVEAVQAADATVVVAGIGVNVDRVESGGDRSGQLSPTDLRAAGGHNIDRNRLVAGLGSALQTRLTAFARDGFVAFADEWNRRDAFRDRPVWLQDGGDIRVSGIERGVDATGALLIDAAGGQRRIISGDLSLRLAAGR